MDVREYLAPDGRSPFGAWVDDLDPQAAAKVTTALARIRLGNLSNVKGVGAGVFECRVDFGPGYRIYFGRDGETIVILVAGGTNRRQQRDITDAQARWQDYKDRKKGKVEMALTRSFKETVQARAQRDPAFREALLTEAVDALLGGDVDVGKAILRDFINATIGFERLAQETHMPSKSLMRMFSAGGNPNARNLFGVIGALQKQAGVQIHAQAVRDAVPS
jgi:putative addiction module killer protein